MMKHDINLKELERKAYLSTFQDGLLDIAIGAMLLVTAFSGILENAGLPPRTASILGICLMLSVPLVVILGKKFITVPRMGMVKFSPARQAQREKAIAALVLTLLITAVVAALAMTRTANFDGFKSHVVGVILIAVPLSVLAYFLQFNRLYIIALLAGIAELIHSFIDNYWVFATAGVIICSMGLYMFVRFLKTYPKSSEEFSHGM
ncbi:MAG: hypothetical protein GY869_20100 [Planctomycetes bacterium]|nr:hypothetical protein [Planctomycetota bacterium]